MDLLYENLVTSEIFEKSPTLRSRNFFLRERISINFYFLKSSRRVLPISEVFKSTEFFVTTPGRVQKPKFPKKHIHIPIFAAESRRNTACSHSKQKIGVDNNTDFLI